MHLAARFVGSGIRNAMPCEACSVEVGGLGRVRKIEECTRGDRLPTSSRWSPAFDAQFPRMDWAERSYCECRKLQSGDDRRAERADKYCERRIISRKVLQTSGQDSTTSVDLERKETWLTGHSSQNTARKWCGP